MITDRNHLAGVFTNLFGQRLPTAGRPLRGAWTFDMDDRFRGGAGGDGIGISGEHLPVSSRTLPREQSRSRHEGARTRSGVVKHIIDAHSQSITVKSSEGRGTAFAFTLQKARCPGVVRERNGPLLFAYQPGATASESLTGSLAFPRGEEARAVHGHGGRRRGRHPAGPVRAGVVADGSPFRPVVGHVGSAFPIPVHVMVRWH